MAIYHAFPNGGGNISLSLAFTGATIRKAVIEFADDGVGFEGDKHHQAARSRIGEGG